MLMLLTFGVHVNYLTEVLPGILVFSLGLSITVAPLTAAILAGIEPGEAGDRLGRQQRGRARCRPDRNGRDRRDCGRAVQLIARSTA